jgi:hypothetical protein
MRLPGSDVASVTSPEGCEVVGGFRSGAGVLGRFRSSVVFTAAD